MKKILIIEDDIKIRDMICEHLNRYGFEASYTEDFRNIESILQKTDAHLIILDINLPYYDGFFILRLIRKKSNMPVIILSARNGDMDQVLGIELGADDYIVKPFNLDVLLARIKSALRRSYGEYSLKEDNSLIINGLSLDSDSFKMSYKNRSLDLSKNEFKLLKILIENAGKVVSREKILEELWDDTTFVDDNTLTVNVTRIKTKLAEIGVNNAIMTKRGAGYLLSSNFSEGENDD